METKNRRYEFEGEAVNADDGNTGLVIDVQKGNKPKDWFMRQGLLIQGADEGTEHHIRTFIPIKKEDNLKMAQIGLELIQMALWNETEKED